jgi:hypothetical protein
MAFSLKPSMYAFDETLRHIVESIRLTEAR